MLQSGYTILAVPSPFLPISRALNNHRQGGTRSWRALTSGNHTSRKPWQQRRLGAPSRTYTGGFIRRINVTPSRGRGSSTRSQFQIQGCWPRIDSMEDESMNYWSSQAMIDLPCLRSHIYDNDLFANCTHSVGVTPRKFRRQVITTDNHSVVHR